MATGHEHGVVEILGGVVGMRRETGVKNATIHVMTAIIHALTVTILVIAAPNDAIATTIPVNLSDVR
jgi:hypothetical protein